MEERAIGLILRTRPLTETSLIVQWLTPELGRIATVAKGARRPKSPFRGKLDLFYECEFTFARSRRSDLHNLREVRLRDTHSELRKELGWIEQASYATTLIEQTTETETPLPGCYQMLEGFLSQLAAHAPQLQSVFAFELKLLGELGLQPNLATSSLTAGSREVVKKLASLDWKEIPSLKPSLVQAVEIQTYLQDFLLEHLGRVPTSRNGALNMHAQRR